jgi:hypothetical protein
MIDTHAVPAVFVSPNRFTLNGGTLSVKLALAGFGGENHLTYKDSHHLMEFSGDEITIETTAFGQVATVTTMNTADIGQTSFSLIIPETDVAEGPHIVATIGLTTMHRRGHGAYTPRQLRTFHVTELRGNAAYVES